MAGITETCSVCASEFEIQFRYQMEERGDGFSFYCSQKCLEKSQTGAEGATATCDACAKRFTPDLVSQIVYVVGRRNYACSLDCRGQILRESHGVRLGDIAAAASGSAPLAPAEPAAPSQPVVSFASPGPRPASPITRPEPPLALATAGGLLDAGTGPDSAQSPGAPNSASNDADIAARMARAFTGSEAPAPTSAPRAPVAARPAASGAVAVPLIPPFSKPRPVANAFGPQVAAPVTSAASAASAAQPVARKPVAPPASAVAPAAAKVEGTPRCIAIFNHKGGTGKTTTAVSVAAGLAARGKRVLLVDTDAQGNVSVSLGASAERSLYHVLVMGLRVSDAVRTVRPNLDLLPSNETLAAAELYLAGRQNRDRVLCERLAPAAAGYDYVVIDCSPSLSLMNQNALVFADSVLVPVACDYLSLVGVRQVIKTVKNVNSLLHHPVAIWGVLPTFFDARAKICHEAVGTLKQHFGERCLPPIRAAIKVKEAPAQGKTIFEYAAGTTAADDYGVVVDAIISSREKPAGRPASDVEGPRRSPAAMPA